jgi:hypothetical protein
MGENSGRLRLQFPPKIAAARLAAGIAAAKLAAAIAAANLAAAIPAAIYGQIRKQPVEPAILNVI